ncbi:MAG TPA: glycosyltransferase family 9 protein [Rhodospirillaceae bacterium]|nr:MAG: hypothetical protein A2018_06310 [Alphaproteobacteria bacterium GWF2_58_20]HAU29126.1 glycosyltransferase family 9 protein [Rhodospirillaceae bacterium]
MAGILFITSNRLGDAVLSMGILSRIIHEHPGVPVTVACGALPAPLFEAFPGVFRVIRLEKGPWKRHWRALFRACILTRWDMVVDLRNSLVSRLLLARTRIIAKPVQGLLRHKVVELAGLLQASPPPAPQLFLPEAACREAERLMAGEGLVLGLGPAANWRGKTWRAERFAALVLRMTAEDGPMPGARVAVFAAKHERAQVQPVLDALPAGRIIDLLDAPGLPVVAACLARCALFIGNDSGLMHMAAAVGRPVVGLFGPSHDEVYAPWGICCRVVRTKESFGEIVSRPGYDHVNTDTLMDSIAVDDVYKVVLQLLGENPCRC